jgi:hypothetical protein
MLGVAFGNTLPRNGSRRVLSDPCSISSTGSARIRASERPRGDAHWPEEGRSSFVMRAPEAPMPRSCRAPKSNCSLDTDTSDQNLPAAMSARLTRVTT